MSKNKLKVSEYAIIDVASSNLVSINNNTSTINPIHAQFNMSFHDNSGREVARLYVTDDGEVDYEGSLTEGAINFIRELSVLSTAYAKDLNLIKLRDLEAILPKELEKAEKKIQALLSLELTDPFNFEAFNERCLRRN